VEKVCTLAIFEPIMHSYAQSSQFAVPLTDVMHLLRFAPYRVNVQRGAILHYSTPNGVWQGAPVYYNLVQGLHVMRWQGTVLNPTGRGFFVRAPGGPLGNFSASHLYEGIEGSTVIRDEFQFENAEYAPIFADLQVYYSFLQRQDVAQMHAQSPTRELPSLDSGYAAG